MAEELTFDLAEQMERASKLPLSGGRATHAVVTFPNLKLFVIYMPAGSVWSEHSTPGRIVVQILRGYVSMNTRDASYDLPAGRGAAFDSNVKHEVHALADSWFLLTVSARTEA